MKSAPDLDAVVARANALGAMYVRARVEGGVVFSTGDSRRRWQALGKRLTGWADGLAALLPSERVRLLRKTGTWSNQAVANGQWALEALGALLWAVRLQRLRGWDRAYGVDILPFVDAPSWFNEGGPQTKGRPSPRLRAAAELEEIRERAEAWHWRAVTAQRPLTAKTRAIIADAARAGADRRWFVEREGDFPYRGRPYASIGDEALSTACSIAVERHRALAWLTSPGVRWDRVSLDT